jgi:hypothetical protein
VDRGVEAEPVDVVLVEPHQGVVDDEPADVGAAVVRAGVAPRGRGPPVLVEVDPAQAVLAPPVELPQVEVRGPEVVVDEVEDDGDAMAVGLAHERLEGVGAAIHRLDGEDVSRVVAPRVVAGELMTGMSSIALTPSVRR